MGRNPILQTKFYTTEKFGEFQSQQAAYCCSLPVAPEAGKRIRAIQILEWWKQFEQRSIQLSLEYTHLLHTDVSNCYGSLYTHSIPWALHTKETAKDNRNNNLIGNYLDFLLRSSRFGQTNGIPQGSTLMDFIAEMVLGYVDLLINKEIEKLEDKQDFHILRYRDDYRIFSNSDEWGAKTLQIIAGCLREVGMALNTGKTKRSGGIIPGSLKIDKWALLNFGLWETPNTKTVQKKFLKLYRFALKHPNSGSVKRLISDFSKELLNKTSGFIPKSDEIPVLISIAVDLACHSPRVVPEAVTIISFLLRRLEDDQRGEVMELVKSRFDKAPYNAMTQIWLQYCWKKLNMGEKFETSEKLCQAVEDADEDVDACLWNSSWLDNSRKQLVKSFTKSIVERSSNNDSYILYSEIALFRNNDIDY